MGKTNQAQRLKRKQAKAARAKARGTRNRPKRSPEPQKTPMEKARQGIVGPPPSYD